MDKKLWKQIFRKNTLFSESSAKSALPKIVKQLKSSDFGMTEKGGNGYVMVKGGKLIIRDPYYYAPEQKRLKNKHNEWSENGTYGKYFKDEYGVKFKVDYVKTIDVEKKHKLWPGYIEIKVTVS